jgi:hypothetical protein
MAAPMPLPEPVTSATRAVLASLATCLDGRFVDDPTGVDESDRIAEVDHLTDVIWDDAKPVTDRMRSGCGDGQHTVLLVEPGHEEVFVADDMAEAIGGRECSV